LFSIESVVNLNTGKAIPGKDKSKPRDAKKSSSSQLNSSQTLKSGLSTKKNSKK
jgi:hypothetical protein